MLAPFLSRVCSTFISKTHDFTLTAHNHNPSTRRRRDEETMAIFPARRSWLRLHGQPMSLIPPPTDHHAFRPVTMDVSPHSRDACPWFRRTSPLRILNRLLMRFKSMYLNRSIQTTGNARAFARFEFVWRAFYVLRLQSRITFLAVAQIGPT